METITRRIERAKDENDILREAASGTFSNGERVEEKVKAERATINNLLEKMNTMEKRNEKRLTKLTKEHKAELKITKVCNFKFKTNQPDTSTYNPPYQEQK